MYSVVIYAVGGGAGHAVRGCVVAGELARAAVVTVVVRRGSADAACRALAPKGRIVETDDGAVPAEMLAVAASTDTLFVDTFPNGWRDNFPILAQAAFAAVSCLRGR